MMRTQDEELDATTVEPDWLTDEWKAMSMLVLGQNLISPTGCVIVSYKETTDTCDDDLAYMVRVYEIDLATVPTDDDDCPTLEQDPKTGELIPLYTSIGCRRVLGILRTYGPWVPAHGRNIAETAIFAATHDVTTRNEVRGMEDALLRLRDAAKPIMAEDGTLICASRAHRAADESSEHEDPWCCHVGFVDVIEAQQAIDKYATNERETFSLHGDPYGNEIIKTHIMYGLVYDNEEDMAFLERLLEAHDGWRTADDDAIMSIRPRPMSHPYVTLHVPASERNRIREIIDTIRYDEGYDAVRGVIYHNIYDAMRGVTCHNNWHTDPSTGVTGIYFDCVPEGSTLEANVNRLEAALVRNNIPYGKNSCDLSALVRENDVDASKRPTHVCEKIRCPRCSEPIETTGTLSLQPDGSILRTTMCAYCDTYVSLSYEPTGLVRVPRRIG